MQRIFQGVLQLSVMGILLLAWVSPGAALILTNTEVTLSQIQDPVTGPFSSTPSFYMEDTFDFDPFAPEKDGVVRSWVFEGLPGTEGEGLYLYGYQIEVYSWSSDKVSGISFDFLRLYTDLDVTGDAIADTSMYCIDCAGGTIAPTSASWEDTTTPPVLRFSFLDPFTLTPTLSPGDISFAFGVISDGPPMVVTANLLDSGGEASPKVYTAPEPTPLWLLGLGILFFGGLSQLGYRWLRRRMQALPEKI